MEADPPVLATLRTDSADPMEKNSDILSMPEICFDAKPMEIEDPQRAYCRTERQEPSFMKSSTDIEEPDRTKARTEREDEAWTLSRMESEP
jgi:hypothetical protein